MKVTFVEEEQVLRLLPNLKCSICFEVWLQPVSWSQNPFAFLFFIGLCLGSIKAVRSYILSPLSDLLVASESGQKGQGRMSHMQTNHYEWKHWTTGQDQPGTTSISNLTPLHHPVCRRCIFSLARLWFDVLSILPMMNVNGMVRTPIFLIISITGLLSRLLSISHIHWHLT